MKGRNQAGVARGSNAQNGPAARYNEELNG
jgi:hypothetical protein